MHSSKTEQHTIGVFIAINPENKIIDYQVNDKPDEGFTQFIQQTATKVIKRKGKPDNTLMLRYDFDDPKMIPEVDGDLCDHLCKFVRESQHHGIHHTQVITLIKALGCIKCGSDFFPKE